MNEAERTQKLKDVQMELFKVAAEQEQLRLNFRALERARTKLTAKVTQLRAQVRRLQPVELKKCRKCGVEMQIDEFFYPDNRYVDGHEPYCKFCKLERARRRAA